MYLIVSKEKANGKLHRAAYSTRAQAKAFQSNIDTAKFELVFSGSPEQMPEELRRELDIMQEPADGVS